MNWLKSIISYTSKINTTGAVVQTSRQVVSNIVDNISTDNAQVIIEFGVGLGNITEAILAKMNSNSVLYAFELEKEFVSKVENKITDKRLILINDSAFKVNNHLKNIEDIDLVISSMPLSFFNDKNIESLFYDVKSLLKPGGKMINILYSKKNLLTMERVFDKCWVVKKRNFPTAFIHYCQKN